LPGSLAELVLANCLVGQAQFPLAARTLAPVPHRYPQEPGLGAQAANGTIWAGSETAIHSQVRKNCDPFVQTFAARLESDVVAVKFVLVSQIQFFVDDDRVSPTLAVVRLDLE
jgi:hypothetical protein